MPHTTSAKKRHRQDSKRRLRNRAVKSAIKSQIKRFETAAEEQTVELLEKEFRNAVKCLDKAAAKRVVHPNLAARKKSQLAQLLHRKKQDAKATASTPSAPPA